MDIEFLESEIRKNFSDAVVEASSQGGILNLLVAFEAKNGKEANNKIMRVLADLGALDFFSAVKTTWYPSKNKMLEDKVRGFVFSALKPIRRGSYEYSVGVEVELRNSDLIISLASMIFMSSAKSNDAKASIVEINEKLLAVSGAKRIIIHVGDGLPSYPQHSSFEGDDDDEWNPNWPSKTGKPSGKGRGNNPPRR
ncbi:hypothetical protein [Billgrantia desiderata]|uniref:hypothetical protein n=1 Tax=Billgrantia desiderata TaxID=52021 RepID=UPI001F213FDE|nr:hypothetical protein [Halomonas desiderata]